MDRKLIKHLLLDKNLRLVELSRQTGVPYDRLVRIVHGYRKPKDEELRTIASALGVSIEQIGAVGTD